MKWLVNWCCGTFGRKCIKFRLQGSSRTQIQAGDFLGDTLTLTMRMSRRGYWSQIQEDILELRLWGFLGGVNVLSLWSLLMEFTKLTHSVSLEFCLQIPSPCGFPLPHKPTVTGPSDKHGHRLQLPPRSWSWPPHSYTHTHMCTYTHTHFSAPSLGPSTFSWPLNAGLHRAHSSDRSSCLHCLARWSHLV